MGSKESSDTRHSRTSSLATSGIQKSTSFNIFGNAVRQLGDSTNKSSAAELGLLRDVMSTRKACVAVLSHAPFVSDRPEEDVWSESAADLIDHLIAAVTRTDGVVESVSGTRILVTWDIVSPCPTFQMQPLAFAHCFRLRDSSIGAGVASGQVVHGYIGSGQRFHAVVGIAAMGAEAMASLAVSLGVTILSAWFPDTPPSLHGDLRPVDAWRYGDRLGDMVVIEQPTATSRAVEEDVEESVGPVWGADFRREFMGAMAGKYESAEWLEKTATEASDEVAMYVAKRARAVVESGGPRPAPFARCQTDILAQLGREDSIVLQEA